MTAAEKPVSGRALKQQVDRLHEELVRLRQKVEMQSGQDGIVRSEVGLDLSDGGAARADDFARGMDLLDQDMADLGLAINGLAQKEPAAPPAKYRRRRISRSDETYRIRLKEEVRNRTVTIRNRGRGLVVNPRVVVNGRRDWFSAESILQEALEPGMSDREKAVAIWAFIRDNRYHYQPGRSDENCDPVRFLNVYGYGLCGVSATNFMLLAELAGLKARVCGLSGHVVPEAYFDGGWHLLDPDGEIYYLDDDGETISSIETLEQRPDIIRKYPSPFYDTEKLVHLYTTTEDNHPVPHYEKPPGAWHTMGCVLRPGESLMRSWDNRGKYFTVRGFADAPRRYGNGALTFEPVFEGDLFRKGAESARGVRAERADGGWALVPSRPGRRCALVYRFASPYPVLDGTVDIAAKVRGKGRLELAFSESGDEWAPVWSAGSSGAVKAGVPIGGHFRNGYGRPVYTYFLRLSMSASRGAAVQVKRLRFTSEVQVAPHSLPALEAGENGVRYVDETPGKRDVEVAFGYDI